MQEQNQQIERQAVVREARSWIGTPFVWQACVKGVGVDCGRFVAASLNGAGVKQIDIAAIPKISPSWFLHCRQGDGSRSPIIEQLERCAVEYTLAPGAKPKPADIVVVQLGRDWAHCALVVDWPRVIGSSSHNCVTEWRNVLASPEYGCRRMRFFDPWGKRV